MRIAQWRYFLPLWLRSLFRRRAVEQEIDDEIRDHLEHQVAANIAAGMSAEEAQRAALIAFGGVERVKDESRDVRRISLVDGVRQDLRFALRSIRRTPAFALVVTATLAMGVGLTATMFGTIDRLLLRPPSHVVAAGELRRVYSSWATGPAQDRSTSVFSYAAYTMFAERSHSFDGVAAYTAAGGTLGQGIDARPIDGMAATGGFFSLLGASAEVGRLFTTAEDDPGSPADVVVLSHELWQAEFGGKRAAIGQRLKVFNRPFTIIGVMPAGFTGVGLQPVAFWVPMSTHPKPSDAWRTTWREQWLEIVVRLKPGVSAAAAEGEITSELKHDTTIDNRHASSARLSLRPIAFDMSGAEPAVYPVARWLTAIALVLLVIACVNVTNLFLARALTRRREIAMRLALGASRSRLLRLLVTESLMLSALGGAAGLLLAHGGAELVRRRFLSDVLWDSAPISPRVAVVSLLLVAGVGLLTSILPVLVAGRIDVADALKSGREGGSVRHARVRATLFIVQASLAMMLLIVAGVFVRSLSNVRALDLGFHPEQALNIEIAWARDSVHLADWKRIQARLAALPEMENAALTIGSPFGNFYSFGVRVPGEDSLPNVSGPWLAAVSPEYFATVGAPLVQGRLFTASDAMSAEPVVVVNETMARSLWPGRAAVGRCLIVGKRQDGPCARVVGVLRDAKQAALHEDPRMQLYIPIDQMGAHKLPAWLAGNVELLARPRVRGTGAVEAARRAIAQEVSEARYVRIASLQDRVDPLMRPWRLGAELFGAFALLALIVAATGIYGVVSYLATQRTHEFGVRAALGARRRDLVSLVIAVAMRLSAAGIAIGIVAMMIGGGWLEPLLFDEPARDPVVAMVVGGALTIVAVMASVVPAWRAACADPLIALRAD